MKKLFRKLASAVVAATMAATTVAAVPASAASSMDTWNTIESQFTGEADDYGIVWYKYSGDSAGATYSLTDDVMTVTTTVDTSASDYTTNSVCYGISAVIKNIQPNTEYTISFKEKAEVTNDLGTHGIYLNTDTLQMNTTTTSPSNNDKTATTRNNTTIGTMHKQSGSYSDADWEEYSYTWTSGEGLSDGYDTLSAKLTFIIRNVSGTFSIKDLTITGKAATTFTAGVWDTLEDTFTGSADDYGIVWYKYSGDSKGAAYSLTDDVMTVTTTVDTSASDYNTNDVCYGISAVIKNIQPNTEYTISFKEKADVTNDLNSHGIYLNTDTLQTTTDATAPSEKVATTRNNTTIGTMHKQSGSYTDSDWEEYSYTWTSGSGLDDGYDTLSAKFTFIIRNASGTFSIRDLTITSVDTSGGETTTGVWNTLESQFTGEANDYGIVWYKYSGDSKGAAYSLTDDVMTVTTTVDTSASDYTSDSVCYGISAVIKNIQPDTEYTISFKEKASVANDLGTHGIYLNTDTLQMNTTTTSPSNNDKTATTRNNTTIGTMHKQSGSYSDADWEEYSYTWTSGEGLSDGYDTLVAKLTFIIRNASGTFSIKDLTITEATAEVTPTITATYSDTVDSITTPSGLTWVKGTAVENLPTTLTNVTTYYITITDYDESYGTPTLVFESADVEDIAATADNVTILKNLGSDGSAYFIYQVCGTTEIAETVKLGDDITATPTPVSES